MTSIEIHRARIRALFETIDTGAGGAAGILPHPRRTEVLDLSPAALAAAPWHYTDRVLARDVVATIDLPRFDNSQMDGYAVLAADLAEASAERPVVLRVGATVPAGEAAGVHAPGSATPVMTGAPLPAGADAVVQIERADPPRFPASGRESGGSGSADAAAAEDGTEARVAFAAPVAPGTFIRRAGSDLAEGEVLLTAGTVLRAPQLGVLATIGATTVEVEAPLQVLVVPTGHEIRPAGAVLADAQIYDANGLILAAALREAGAEARVVPCTSDDPAVLLELLRAHESSVDLVLTVGGVSAGAFEVVRDTLEPLGASFGHVDMQPGGPQGHGLVTVDGGETHVPVVSVPGNPVSALVSFEVFLRPLLRERAGLVPAERPRLLAVLTEAVDSPARLDQFRRGHAEIGADGTVTVTPLGGPSSHLLHAYAQSNALIHVPAGVSHLEAGDDVEIWRIDG